jgi:hypothetical protein
VHAVIARRAAAAAAAVSVLLAAAFAAPSPARAGIICEGQGCSISLAAYVNLSGDDTGNNTGVVVPPPSCWYTPVTGTSPAEGGPAGAAVPMDKFFHAAIKANSGTWSDADGGGGGGGTTSFSQFVGQADQVSNYKSYAHPQAGSWYALDTDGSPTGDQCEAQRPWLVWVPLGQLPPPPTVSPLTLARYAYKYLSLPYVTLRLNPPKRSIVTLPTYVKTQMNANFLPDGQPYRHVTASIPGLGLTVTVWVLAGNLNLSAGTANATVYQPCHTMGTTADSQQMSRTGPNAAIDCGVTYRQPSTGGAFTLTGTITWKAYWAATASQAPTANARPVPGGTLTSQSQVPVTVAEIQNLNN